MASALMDAGRARIVGGHHQRAVQRDGQAAHGGAHLWNQLAAACVGGEVPYADVAMLVACARMLAQAGAT